MTDKQITIDYKNLCANYSKEVGCYNTFDGSCIKEQCFTYRLLQLLKAKEQECERLVNKNNILSEKLDTTQLLLEGKNNQYAAKMQVCDELHSIIQNRNEEIKNLNYVLYEERELTLDLGKANLKIASLERNISSHKNRFKYEIDKLKKELSSLLAEKNAIEIGRYEYKQECEELKKDLHKNFEEKDKLHLIIDRLLEASGYDTNTASAEDFEDVYENMRYEKQQLDQLKADNDELRNFHINLVGVKECNIRELLKLKQALTEIKEIAENSCCLQPTSDCEEYKKCNECSRTSDDVTVKQILQKISECEVRDDKSNR